MTEAENGNWYMVNRDGMATLCTDRADAEKEAADAQSVWPHMGPHRAVRLVEASFEAADIATAAAEGFRAGHESNFSAADMAAAKAEGFREGDKAAVREMQPALEKALGQRRVLCDLLRECLPIIDAMLQTPGDDASDAHLQGLHGRVQDALVAVAEERLHECMA